MFKTKPAFYSILLLLFCNLACGQTKNKDSKAITKGTEEKTAEWTVLIYMDADNNLEPFAIQNFLDMARIGSSDKVNIVVQFDRSPGYEYTHGNWSQTLRFRVGKGMDPTEDKKIEDIGEANMGDGKTLSDFVNWGMKKYPAKKYMLDVWDHGSGYRLFETLAKLKEQGGAQSNTEAVETRTTQVKATTKNTKTFQSNGSSDGSPYRSCSHDETDADELYNREIQDALEPIAGQQKKKFDVIGFDCCLMAMVETAFAFRNTANYMVGSEDLEPGPGWQYDDWLSKLVANPSMDGAQLSKLLVNSYRKKYQMTDPTTTLSAIDLSKMDIVATAISDFAVAMSQSVKRNLNPIKKARRDCNNYAPNHTVPNPYYHIDFIRFCDLVAASSADPILKQKAASVKTAVKSTVLDSYSGGARRGNFGSWGLAIYFPNSGKAYDGDQRSQGGYEKTNTLYPVEFVQKHKWADFLHDYFKEVK